MDIWKIINSPFIISLISVLLGGIVASIISLTWQKRAERHSMRIELLKDILRAYHEYVRFLRRDDMINNQNEFDRVHSEMLSKAKIAYVIFDNQFGKKLRTITDKMNNVHNLRKQGMIEKAEKERLEVYEQADSIIENLYLFLH
jgi:hypothetical protein